VDNRLLDCKYKTIFKSKRNEQKLINGWDLKIERNWGEKIERFVFNDQCLISFVNGNTINTINTIFHIINTNDECSVS
jgi:hypothetical protein